MAVSRRISVLSDTGRSVGLTAEGNLRIDMLREAVVQAAGEFKHEGV